MQPEIKKVFLFAEAERQALLTMVAKVPEEKFTRQRNNQWSPSQIISHIIHSENISLRYMKKKALGIDQAGNTGMVEALKFYLLKISQRLPLRYKAPKVLGENTPAALPLGTLRAQWDAARDELSEFCAQLKADELKKKLYKHPVAGRLNIVQAVQFMREHVNHHLPQIKSRMK